MLVSWWREESLLIREGLIGSSGWSVVPEGVVAA